MKLSNVISWILFFIVIVLIIIGTMNRGTMLGKTLLIIGYVFGFPFLFVPFAALVKWSNRRSDNQEEDTSEGNIEE